MPDTHTSPSPPPAPSAARRRRHRRRHLLLSPFSAAGRATSPSAASSSAYSSPASSLFSFSRSPSPFHHRFRSPLHAASAVPFAWEHRPGVPKTPVRLFRANSRPTPANKALPLPPSHRLLSGSKVGAADSYSIIAAAEDGDDCFVVPGRGAKDERLGRRVRRQPALAAGTLTDCLAVLRLCLQSCARSRDCLAEAPPQRPRGMASKAVTGWSGY